MCSAGGTSWRGLNTTAIEEHYCPLQEAYGIVLHIQDDVED